MSNDSVQNPGYYNVRSLVIQSVTGHVSEHFNVNALDITGLVPALSVSTSIEQPALVGSFRVLDGVGVLEKYPLRGEERAQIVIEDSLENELQLDVFCYKIDDVSASPENGVISYTVHFVSFQSFQAGRFEIIKAYKEKTASDIVNEMFVEYYSVRRSARPSDRAFPGQTVTDPTSKNIVVYPETDGILRCTIPKLKPDEAMQFIARRSFSQRSPSSTYRFFENSRSYCFTTDEALFDTANQQKRSFEFTFADAIPKDPSFFEQAMNNLNTLVNAKRVNTIDDMYNGAYRNKVVVLDVLKGSTNLNAPGFNYMENRGAFFDTRSEDVEDRHTEQFASQYFNEDIQKTFLLVKDYMDSEGNGDATMAGDMSLDIIGSNRVSYRKHINSTVVEASGPGRVDITAGDVVSLNINEFNTESNAPELNKQLSGRYIVKSVVHDMSADTMVNRYVLMKRDWSNTRGQTNIGLLPRETSWDGEQQDGSGSNGFERRQ